MDTRIIAGANNFQAGLHTPPVQVQAPQENPTKVVVPVKENQDTNIQADSQDKNQERLDAIKRILGQRYSYPVSDSRFTIYREGETYVTRVTSLSDGKVTYIKEPNLVNEFPALARSFSLATEA